MKNKSAEMRRAIRGWSMVAEAHGVAAAELWISEAKTMMPEDSVPMAFASEMDLRLLDYANDEAVAFVAWIAGLDRVCLAGDDAAAAPRIPREWAAPVAAFWAALERKIADKGIPDDVLLRTIEEAAGRLPALVEAMGVGALADLFEAGMGAAALAGAKSGLSKALAADAALAAEAEIAPLADAVAKLGRKTPVGAKLSSEAFSRLPVALRERAQFSAFVESMRFLNVAQDKLTSRLTLEKERVAHGEAFVDRDSFIRDMRRVAEEEGIETTGAGGRDGLRDIRSVSRLGLIYDIQTKSAADYARWKMGQDPDVLDEFPAWRFTRVEAVKSPRDWHAQFEGAVRLKSDLEFWTSVNQDFGVPWGPWGWGCGHDVEEVDRDEAESLGLIKAAEAAQPAEKEFNDQLDASTEGWSPDQVGTLKSAFGDQVAEQGGKVRWQGNVVRDLVDRTLAEPGWNGKALDLGKASAAAIQKAAQHSDIEGMRMKIDPSHIRKTWRDHGPVGGVGTGSGESRSDQIPLTKTDYELIPHVWRDPDTVYIGKRESDLVFEKRLAGTLVGVSWSVAPGKTMMLKSIYKKN